MVTGVFARFPTYWVSPVFKFYHCILYLPLHPQVHGRKLLQHWRASREFHPSELPPWREAVAGQESHDH